MIARLCLRFVRATHQQQLSLEPIQLCFVPTLFGLFHRSLRLGQDIQPSLDLSRFSIRLGRQGQKIRTEQLRSRRLPGGKALAEKIHSLFFLFLLG